MKVIHLVRDGRGFSFFISPKNHKLPRTELPLAARAPGTTASRPSTDSGGLFAARPVLSVRYEDLCHDLTATLNRVCEFLDVPYESALENPEAQPGHVLGNRMPSEFFRSGLRNACKRQRELTPEEIG